MFMGLVIPNQYCRTCNEGKVRLFFGNILGQEIRNLHDPYYTVRTVILYDAS